MPPLLTDAQFSAFRERFDAARGKDVPRYAHVRFIIDGRAAELETGYLTPRGTNVIHQPVYWDWPVDIARDVARATGARIEGKRQ